MVIGAGQRVVPDVRYLVERLPAMIAPAWLRNRTQPIAIEDVLEYLVQAAERPDVAAGEVQIGGPDVLHLLRGAGADGRCPRKRRRPEIPVPFLTRGLSSLWIGLVTPVDTGVARPLVEEPRERNHRDRSGAGGGVRRAADGLPSRRFAVPIEEEQTA